MTWKLRLHDKVKVKLYRNLPRDRRYEARNRVCVIYCGYNRCSIVSRGYWRNLSQLHTDTSSECFLSGGVRALLQMDTINVRVTKEQWGRLPAWNAVSIDQRRLILQKAYNSIDLITRRRATPRKPIERRGAVAKFAIEKFKSCWSNFNLEIIEIVSSYPFGNLYWKQ